MDGNKLYIGISGKMGSGKSTIRDEIIKSLDSLKCDTVSLAAPIKRVEKVIYKDLGIEHTKKDRQLLIQLGMWGRGIDPDFWLKQAVKMMKKSKADVVICDDVRFLNEAEWFDNNGILLRLEGKQRGDNVNPEFADSISETQLDYYDFKYIIDNTGSIEATSLMALYHISKHIGAINSITEQMAKEVNDGRQKEGEEKNSE